MKTHRSVTSIRNLRNRASLMVCIILLSLTCVGQSVWKDTEAKGENTIFKSEVKMGSIYIQNSKTTDSYQGREEYNPEKSDFSYVRITSHDVVLNAFRKAFSLEEITTLSEGKERVSIFLDVDERGQILSISFSIKEATRIRPVNIEILENELLNNMHFEVIGKMIDQPIFYRPSFRVYFSEVEAGEIRMVRNSVNLKLPNEI